MNRPIRIGLIAEGETELGSSVPYLKPEEGGKEISRENEGALHTLIRRELCNAGLSDCSFVHRHPSLRERGIKLRTGHSVLQPKYLKQVVSVWKPEEVDIILIVVDADNALAERQKDLEKALNTIRDNHLDINGQLINDRSTGGLAIKNFDTWLLADTQTVSGILEMEIDPLENLEEVDNTKVILEEAIATSSYLSETETNQHPLQIKWNLASQINLEVIKACCPNGYAPFIKSLIAVARVVQQTP